MIRKVGHFLLILLAVQLETTGQVKNVREDAVLHLNSRFLITGETLLFAAYVNSTATGKPSPLSRILYVELLDASDQPVFQKKIRLKDGRGYGEFFVNSLTSTGNYRLIAYTRWMRNFESYYQAEISVVNPFEAYQAPASANPALSASFFPEGGQLIVGASNRVILKVTDGTGRFVSFRGSIVDDSGEKITDLAGDGNGPTRFELIPEGDRVYPAILEDETGELHFFKLPKPLTNAVTVQVRELENTFDLRLAMGPEWTKEVVLQVEDEQSVLERQRFTSSAGFDLNKTDLRTGLYQASVYDKNENRLSTTSFFHFAQNHDPNLQVRDTYQKRSLVRLPVLLEQDASVSISVRKKQSRVSPFATLPDPDSPEILTYDPLTLSNYLIIRPVPPVSIPDTVALLPETRGEIISGVLQNASGQLVPDQLVTYTILAESHYQFQTAKTDQNGQFQINIDPIQEDRTSYLSVFGDQSDVRFRIDKPFPGGYPAFEFYPLYLDSMEIVDIVRRSVRNQVENAFYEPEADSADLSGLFPLFGGYDAFYLLDDYNRFPSLSETFIEYIPGAAPRKAATRLNVQMKFQLPGARMEPLILLDGVPASAEEVLSFSPYKVKSIGLINNRIFIGPLVADGLVTLRTFEQDLQGFDPGGNTMKVAYKGLEREKAYRFPAYDNQPNERIPDLRDQLFWDPVVTIRSGQPYPLEFYTSDTAGAFEIIIQGFDAEGEPVLLSGSFTVTDANPPVSD